MRPDRTKTDTRRVWGAVPGPYQIAAKQLGSDLPSEEMKTQRQVSRHGSEDVEKGELAVEKTEKPVRRRGRESMAIRGTEVCEGEWRDVEPHSTGREVLPLRGSSAVSAPRARHNHIGPRKQGFGHPIKMLSAR